MYPRSCSNAKAYFRRGNVFVLRLEFVVSSDTYLPGLCVANKAPADTEVTRKLLSKFPLSASQAVEAFSNARAAVFLS